MITQDLPPLVFNPMDPDYARDPYPLLNRLRDEAPVYFWEAGKGAVFFRWRDINALYRETRLGHDPAFGTGMPAQMKAAFPDFAEMHENSMFTMPVASHARVRKLLNPAFGPRAVDVHQPKVERILAKLLASMPEDGVINGFQDYARQYPVRVISAVLNIPDGHEADFIAFADALIATIFPGVTPQQFASYMPAFSKGMAVTRQCIAERRQNPMENDLLTLLINACDDQDRLSDGELTSLVGGLIVGGADTTTYLTGNTLLELHRHPDQLALLRQDPSLARNTLDETLRYHGFGRTFLPRYVNETFEYEGLTLERGTAIYLCLASAFRDLEFAPDADVYDIRRKHTGSPWFGFGPHFCLGASLARLEAAQALNMFFARYPKTELVGEPVYGNHPLMRDMLDLPIRVNTTA